MGDPYSAAKAMAEQDDFSDWGARRWLRLQYAWTAPTEEAIDRLVECGPLIEIGAGTGYWASLIEQRGGDVVCFDKHPPQGITSDEANWHAAQKPFHPVAQGGPDDAARYPERTLFLCWPPYDDPMGADAIAAYYEAGGRQVAYIGEPGGGCTGDDEMAAMLGIGPSGDDGQFFAVVDSCDVNSWETMNDSLWIFERIGTP